LATEFTNLTATTSPPIIPLSAWTINANQTTGSYLLNSGITSLFLELTPTSPYSMATAYTVNCPSIPLSNYAYVNITATGTSNAAVMLGFFLSDGTNMVVANMTDVPTLNSMIFNLTT
jgi:hypothetical protein